MITAMIRNTGSAVMVVVVGICYKAWWMIESTEAVFVTFRTHDAWASVSGFRVLWWCWGFRCGKHLERIVLKGTRSFKNRALERYVDGSNLLRAFVIARVCSVQNICWSWWFWVRRSRPYTWLE
jgi:hypothetical protein